MQPRFWKGQQLVSRQRNLHTGGAAAGVALVISRPRPDMSADRLAVLCAATAALILIFITLALPPADRHEATLANAPSIPSQIQPDTSLATRWCQVLLGVGAAVLVGAFFTGGWSPELALRGTLPGFTDFWVVLLMVQALLLLLLALAVFVLARRAPRPSEPSRTGWLGLEPPRRSAVCATQTAPYAAGQLTTIFAVLAVCLGGIFSAVLDLFVTRLLGTPVPSGIRFSPMPSQGVHSQGAGYWRQLMAGSGGSQGLPAMAMAMASSAVVPWAAAESR